MAQPQHQHEIVQLSSDSAEDDLAEDEHDDFFDLPTYAHEDLGDAEIMDDMWNNINPRHSPDFGAANSVVDLTNISDVDSSSSEPFHVAQPPTSLGTPGIELFTEAMCLQMILDVLPDIAIEHALNLIREKTTDETRTLAQCEHIVSVLLDGGAYPKEADEANDKKRKRDDEEEWSVYEKADGENLAPTYASDTVDLLKDEFLDVPVRHITNVVKEHKTLFKAYGILEEQIRNYERVQSSNSRRYANIAKPRIKRGIEAILIERGSQLPKELHAAKQKLEVETAKRRKAEEAVQAEENNLKRAQESGEMGECACCFGDVPLNRMISCSGEEPHSYCMDCPKRQIETQMGQSRCTVKCFGVDDCDGTFTRGQLQQVLCAKTFERLEHMQQQADLAAAGLDFLSECPFCDFKMECPPVEVDKEFRCQSTKCGKTSCRLCQKDTHIPLSCEEAKKDGQLTLRHIVEEAMSAALIRHCNRCKHPFIKEHGCNKMNCSHCSNLQCYVCSKNVTNYDHFGEVGRGRCPLHENVEERHEQEVKKAADEAMAKVRADNPGLSDADLMIKVSDRVKQAEDARRSRGGVQVYGGDAHLMAQRGLHMPQVYVPDPAAIPPPPAPRHHHRARPRLHQVAPPAALGQHPGNLALLERHINPPHAPPPQFFDQHPRVAHHHVPQELGNRDDIQQQIAVLQARIAEQRLVREEMVEGRRNALRAMRRVRDMHARLPQPRNAGP